MESQVRFSTWVLGGSGGFSNDGNGRYHGIQGFSMRAVVRSLAVWTSKLPSNDA